MVVSPVRGEGQRGQALPLVAVLVVAAGAGCLVLGRIGGAAVARASAVTAADAAALAGAAGGRAAASETARANGARLVSYEEFGTDTRVRVERGGARATARARRSGGRGGSHRGPGPGLSAALARAEQLLAVPVPVVRSRAGTGGVSPGEASHRHGLAVDVAESFVPRLMRVARAAGLCQAFPEAHPVHFEVCPARLP